MKAIYKPRRVSEQEKASAHRFFDPALIAQLQAKADAEADYTRTQEAQDLMTADAQRAYDLADKAKFAKIEAEQEQRAFLSDPDMRAPHYELRDDQRPVTDARRFMLAGNAVFTIVSKKTGERFTYRVRQPDASKPHFVSVLTGSDNENSYTFLGSIFVDGTYRHGRRSTIGPAAPSAKAFSWFYANLDDEAAMGRVEVYHEGRCCRCGRRLTVPSSIESGIGPECAQK